MELQILRVNVLAAKFANVFVRVDLLATVLHAGYFKHATLGYLYLQVVLNTILALQMTAA